MPDLLIEIGTEELPSSALDVVYSELKPALARLLGAYRLSYGKISVEATPRRIALGIQNLAGRQTDQTLEIRGLPVERAYDEKGEPTSALMGFLRGKGGSLRDIEVRQLPKGRVVIFKKREKGKPAEKVLKDLFQELLQSLSFPKNMRWESSGFRFPRPVRWLVMLLDKKVIPLYLAGVKAQNKSFGHRFLSPRPFLLHSANWQAYVKALRRAHVVLSEEERKEWIRKGLKRRFHQNRLDEELVTTAAQLVEEPFLLEGSFSKTYLELPPEVLVNCMKKNQKIFGCYDARGRLTSKFVAVLNGKRRNLTEIRRGYENVLDARLRDARYFYEADTREPLEKKLPLLEQIIYLGKLGNMLERTERLETFSRQFAALIGRHDLAEDLIRVARLAKIDLMTQLVYEFPDLQGIAGREYALESKEKEAVAEAIGTQYLPKSLMQDYRELKKVMTPLGAMFGIVDRLDHLVGAFGIGLEPTGSQDPYALRRAGGAVVKILRAFGFHFSLREAVEIAVRNYEGKLDLGGRELVARLMAFFRDRIVGELQPEPGSRQAEILEAVLRTSFDDVADAFLRFGQLVRLYEREPRAFLKAAKVVERTANIIGGVEINTEIDSSLFHEDLEKRLFDLVQQREGEIDEFLKRGDYERATFQFGQIFFDTLHDFFEQVMVNVEDMSIRRNRQALMKRIYRLYADRVADLSVLSKIEVE